MTLPNFLIIGAMNAGTTSLYRYLRDHPQVFMSTPKELYFFTEEGNWWRGRSWYEARFDRAGGAIAVGEASVGYTMHPIFSGVPERIAALIPDVRLIYLLRDPIERMRTQYLHYRFPDKIKSVDDAVGPLGDGARAISDDPAVAAALNRGRDERPVEEALRESPLYLNCSRYAMQIERYLSVFETEQLLLLDSERLRMDPEATMQQIYRFLGIEEEPRRADAAREHNRTSDRRVPSEALLTLQRAPGVRGLRRIVPTSVKAALRRRLFLRNVDVGAARITDDLRRRLEQLLRDDVRSLRRYMDDGFDGWGIA